MLIIYKLMIKNQLKTELKLYGIGFAGALIASTSFLIRPSEPESYLLYYFLWMIPLCDTFIHFNASEHVAKVYWSKYANHTLLYFRILFLFRMVHALVHMLFISILNQAHVFIFESDFTSNFWGLQIYLATFLLYGFTVGASTSIRQAKLSLKRIQKLSLGLLRLIVPIMLTMIVSKITDIIFDTTASFTLLGTFLNIILVILNYYFIKTFIDESENM
ncbi:hypothetical protein [Gracilibacillus thailandensis]|uniref:Uncharacterized protein n=2 Tax=Gracilibacillus thailandensis TaxID=563735 RepID=A0A6N7QS41_9BACI|nr:hypothetical protein [Gracilibacillus thailandensis]MRI64833.1 hypothetical protein [Gracilibacillus thailandensis]